MLKHTIQNEQDVNIRIYVTNAPTFCFRHPASPAFSVVCFADKQQNIIGLNANLCFLLLIF